MDNTNRIQGKEAQIKGLEADLAAIKETALPVRAEEKDLVKEKGELQTKLAGLQTDIDKLDQKRDNDGNLNKDDAKQMAKLEDQQAKAQQQLSNVDEKLGKFYDNQKGLLEAKQNKLDEDVKDVKEAALGGKDKLGPLNEAESKEVDALLEQRAALDPYIAKMDDKKTQLSHSNDEDEKTVKLEDAPASEVEQPEVDAEQEPVLEQNAGEPELDVTPPEPEAPTTPNVSAPEGDGSTVSSTDQKNSDEAEDTAELANKNDAIDTPAEQEAVLEASAPTPDAKDKEEEEPEKPEAEEEELSSVASAAKKFGLSDKDTAKLQSFADAGRTKNPLNESGLKGHDKKRDEFLDKAEAASPGSFSDVYKDKMNQSLNQAKDAFEKGNSSKDADGNDKAMDENEAFARLMELILEMLALLFSPATNVLAAGGDIAAGKFKEFWNERQADLQDEKFNNPVNQEKLLKGFEAQRDKSEAKIKGLEDKIANSDSNAEKVRLGRELNFEQAKLQVINDAIADTCCGLVARAADDGCSGF